MTKRMLVGFAMLALACGASAGGASAGGAALDDVAPRLPVGGAPAVAGGSSAAGVATAAGVSAQSAAGQTNAVASAGMAAGGAIAVPVAGAGGDGSGGSEQGGGGGAATGGAGANSTGGVGQAGAPSVAGSGGSGGSIEPADHLIIELISPNDTPFEYAYPTAPNKCFGAFRTENQNVMPGEISGCQDLIVFDIQNHTPVTKTGVFPPSAQQCFSPKNNYLEFNMTLRTTSNAIFSDNPAYKFMVDTSKFTFTRWEAEIVSVDWSETQPGIYSWFAHSKFRLFGVSK